MEKERTAVDILDEQVYGVVLYRHQARKGERIMDEISTEADRQNTRKAMAFDLFNILDANPKEKTYTVEEIKKLIITYIVTTDHK